MTAATSSVRLVPIAGISDERGEERAEQAADGRERVQATGDRSCVAHVLDAEPHRERRDHAEQDHRRREEREHGEERADRRTGRDLVEPLHRDVEERSCRKGDDRDQHACGRPRCGRALAGSGCGPRPFRPASSRGRARRGRGRSTFAQTTSSFRSRARAAGRPRSRWRARRHRRRRPRTFSERVEPRPSGDPVPSAVTEEPLRPADDDERVVVAGLAGELARVGDDVLREALGGEPAARGERSVEPLDPVLDSVAPRLDQPVGVEARALLQEPGWPTLPVSWSRLDAEREPCSGRAR